MSFDQKSAIAIIGMGCRFPGGIDSPGSLWTFLRDGGDAIVDVPADRWSVERFYSSDPSVPGKTYVRRGGFLRDPVDRFDPLFFGISPREAQHMDPQQRLLLEVAWEAMEDGGLIPAELAGSRTGVYVGGFAVDAMTILMSPLGRKLLDSHHTATAASMTMLAARLSYIFDFRGPSMTIDTACSSSLVAIHNARKALLSGECDLAIAGGVNVMLSAEYPIIMSKGHFLAPDGHCKSFDAKADGYARGEGCGLVLLKKLDDAIRDGDPVQAILRGSGVNQDGRTDGITVPSAAAQEALIRDVYASAGVPLQAVSYVEAHGTGTPIGDPVEAGALGRTMGADRDRESPLIIGSVKANIGHLEAAAGVAGFIKACLCLRHRAVPRQIHLDQPNPGIPFAGLGLTLPFETVPLPDHPGRPLYAGVNSFGYGGTNAHVILESYTQGNEAPAVRDDAPCLLPVSARSEGALRLMAEAYAGFLERDDGPPAALVAATAAGKRSHFEHRLAVYGTSRQELASRLRLHLAGDVACGVAAGRVRAARDSGVVFVYSGMGPQWWGMGQALLASEPVFRASAEACDAAFQAVAGWPVLAEMQAPEAFSRMTETRIAQPANFVLQVALTALLKTMGIVPAAVAGHSVGEVAAAHVAGALDLEDAVRVVYHRSRLQQLTAGTGTMLAVGLGPDDCATWIRNHASAVSIAAVNSARSVTLAGAEPALGEIAEALADAGIFHRFLAVEVPYHSPLMDPLREELIASLEGLRPKAPAIPLYSTVTGARWTADDIHDGAYWFRNLRDPVHFAAAMDSLITDGHTLFAEIGPSPVLSSSIRDGLAARGAVGDAVYSLRRKDDEAVRPWMMAGELYTLGYSPEWRTVNGDPVPGLKLPAYRWERGVYWCETPEVRADRLGAQVHPLLGAPVPVAAGHVWSADLNANYLPWLGDHVVEDAIVFPGAAYVEACLAIHAESESTEPAIIENVSLTDALMLNPASGETLQWSFDPKTRLCTAATLAPGADVAWRTHASAQVLASQPWAAAPRDLDAIRARCAQVSNTRDLYANLAARGLHYGPAFQCVADLRRGKGEVLAQLALGTGEAARAGNYRVHPALLDAAFQALIGACDEGSGAPDLFLPVAIRQILYHAPVGAAALAHGQLTRQSSGEIEGDITLLHDDGSVVLEVKGLRCHAIGGGRKASKIPLGQWVYDYHWEPSETPVTFANDSRWLIFTDEGATGHGLMRFLANQGAREIIEVVPGEAYARHGANRYTIRPSSGEDMTALFADANIRDCQGVVDLWTSDQTREDAADPTGIARVASLLAIVKALPYDETAPRLFVVTSGARCVTPADGLNGLDQAAVTGLVRVVALERPELRATLIDIDRAPKAIVIRRLGVEIASGTSEDDVALRGAGRFVHRLANRAGLLAPDENTVACEALAGGQPCFKLVAGAAGNMDQLRFRETPRHAPGQGEIELKILATALNFKDVLKVLGVLPQKALDGTFHGTALGMEASAVVTAVGTGVDGYAVGDRVIASIPGCLASHVTVLAASLFALKAPAGWSGPESAGIPVAFMTAYYALHDLARLQRGETVLIHAATGGVGLAAIQIAQWLGAEIHATAGSPAKREHLKALGVPHIWDSRSLEFASGIRAATGGKGVDVVLNSLPGEAFQQSLALLAPFGRFVEIGKRDIMENSQIPMLAFNENLSFNSVDLDRMMVERPDMIQRMLGEIAALMDQGVLRPVPVTVFPAARTVDAFRFMAGAKQIGKVAVDFETTAGLEIIPLAKNCGAIRPEATYLVTGAFGGAGRELCRTLVAQGVRNLVLVGRGGAASADAQAFVGELEATGARVEAARLDVANFDDVLALIEDIQTTMPPLAGIFHAAAILDDALLAGIDPARIEPVMAAKALGAWNLHQATQHVPLDLFVLFSSATSLIGNPGQGIYVAANTFLDALAMHRRARGQAATSINWGAIGDAGMLAGDGVAARQLERAGVRQIPVKNAMAVLPRVLALNRCVIAVMDVEWGAWRSVFPAAKALPRFQALAAETRDRPASDAQAALLALPPELRLGTLAANILDLVAAAVHVAPDKIDRQRPLSELGIDSLVGIELQTAISEKLGLQISILQLMKSGTIEDIAASLLKKISAARVAAPALPPAVSPADDHATDPEGIAA